MVWYGMVWYGMVWYGMVWYGMVWYGMVWYGMVWYGMVWYGMVWYGMEWYCMLNKSIDEKNFMKTLSAFYGREFVRQGCSQLSAINSVMSVPHEQQLLLDKMEDYHKAKCSERIQKRKDYVDNVANHAWLVGIPPLSPTITNKHHP
jgi:hypothetical protein